MASRDMRLAKEIRVEADPSGAPHIIVDGEELPWFTSGIVPSAPSIGGMATLTVTFLAEKITLANNLPDGTLGTQKPLCVSCGRQPATYENYRGQWLCGPCADGTSPEATADVALSLIEDPRGELTNDFLRKVATAYLRLGEVKRAPAPAIAEQTGRSVRTVHGWIAEARRRGHLPTGRRGQIC